MNDKAIVPTGDSADPHRALLMQTFNEAQVDFLLQRTPPSEVKRRQGKGGRTFSYVEHGYVTERLNLVFGFNWDFEVTDKQILDDEVIVEGRLTVRTPQGQTIVKHQFGGADIERHTTGPKAGRPLSIADNYKAAASDCLKKCASLLGIGLDLYGREMEPSDEEAQAPPAPTRRNQEPERRVAVAQASPQQIKEIRMLVGDIAEYDRQWSLKYLCDTLKIGALEDLTHKHAAAVLNRLSEMLDDHRKNEAAQGDTVPYRVVSQLQPAPDFTPAEQDELDQAFTDIPEQATAPAQASVEKPAAPTQKVADDDFDRVPSGEAVGVTEKQIKAIYAIGKARQRLSNGQVDDRCAEVFGVKPSELTRAEASTFIDMLQGDKEAS